jgi:tRNA uridine 5-carbamoylmethylation protein Kti12
MKTLILLRGLPGSGKSTLAGSLEMVFCYEADKYFEDENGKYNFDPTKIKQAHQWCQDRVEKAMNAPNGFPPPRIVVSNPFTQEWEMEAYYKLAKQYGYMVYSLIVENRHGGINEHSVPEETIEKMRNRFEIKL